MITTIEYACLSVLPPTILAFPRIASPSHKTGVTFLVLCKMQRLGLKLLLLATAANRYILCWHWAEPKRLKLISAHSSLMLNYNASYKQ